MSNYRDLMARIGELDRQRKLLQRAEMVKNGELPGPSALPHRVPIGVGDVSIVDGDPMPSARVLDVLDRSVNGKGELGFDRDGTAHVGLEDETDEMLVRTALA